MNTVIITGITGQDGSYLARRLLQDGSRVIGVCRRVSSRSLWRIAEIKDALILEEGDVTDLSSLIRLFKRYTPTHIYNLAAQSFVPTSWKQPILTSMVTGLGAVNVFEAARLCCPNARIYQASSSEMFGLQPSNTKQKEDTSFHPRSPYGCSKAYAHHMAVNYRESYGMFICCGILFNHESEFRGREFVTRKIAIAVAEIASGRRKNISLGTLSAERDWGFAGDYVHAMIAMLEQNTPDDFVIASGTKYSVQDFARLAFQTANIDWKDVVVVDPSLHRPAEIPALCGDATKAFNVLQWSPSHSFSDLIARMVDAEHWRLKNDVRTDD